MIKLAHVLFTFVFLLAGAARAEQVQGLVRINGNPPFKRVVVTKPDEYSGSNLCPGDKANRLMALESLVVKISGKDKMQGKSKCFEVGSFTVLKTPAGRDATVGVLEYKKGSLHITAEDGRSLKLIDVPPELKALVGKKLIVDLKAVQGSTDSGYQTVYYAEFP